MKKIKRFEIDVEVAFLEDDYEVDCPLTIADLNENYVNAQDGYNVAEILIQNKDNNYARAQIQLEHIDAIIDVLTHIKKKVLETNPELEEKTENSEKTV